LKEKARINNYRLEPTKLSMSDMKSLDPPRAFFILVGEVRRTV
jgi:hypothetical protein